MNIQPSNEHDESELERAVVATTLSAATDPHQTPTVVPPPPDDSEPPPTVRWTPPPVLIARSRFDGRVDDARRGSSIATAWSRR